DILGDRARTGTVLEEDIAKARLALALCPGVHAIAEGATDRLGTVLVLGRDSPDFNLWIGFDLVGENLEARTCEMLGNCLNFNRVPQVRLVRTILADGRIIRNARPFLGHALAFGKLLEHRRDDGLDSVPDVFLG